MNSNCPICDAQMPVDGNVEVSEVLSCPDCKSRLVVISKDKLHITLSKAPDVEEDWGE